MKKFEISYLKFNFDIASLFKVKNIAAFMSEKLDVVLKKIVSLPLTKFMETGMNLICVIMVICMI